MRVLWAVCCPVRRLDVCVCLCGERVAPAEDNTLRKLPRFIGAKLCMCDTCVGRTVGSDDTQGCCSRHRASCRVYPTTQSDTMGDAIARDAPPPSPSPSPSAVTLRKLRILALNGNSLRKLPKRIDLLQDLEVLKVYNQVRTRCSVCPCTS